MLARHQPLWLPLYIYIFSYIILLYFKGFPGYKRADRIIFVVIEEAQKVNDRELHN